MCPRQTRAEVRGLLKDRAEDVGVRDGLLRAQIEGLLRAGAAIHVVARKLQRVPSARFARIGDSEVGGVEGAACTARASASSNSSSYDVTGSLTVRTDPEAASTPTSRAACAIRAACKRAPTILRTAVFCATMHFLWCGGDFVSLFVKESLLKVSTEHASIYTSFSEIVNVCGSLGPYKRLA